MKYSSHKKAAIIEYLNPENKDLEPDIAFTDLSNEKKHFAYVKIKSQINYSTDVFSSDEIKVLQKFGAWLEALHLEKIVPITEEQKKFVTHMDNNTEPKNKIANIWFRYFNRAIQMIERPDQFNLDYQLISNEFYSNSDYDIMHIEWKYPAENEYCKPTLNGVASYYNPDKPSRVSHEKYSGKYEIEWKNFGQRITKNSFVRKYLEKKEGKICCRCNKVLNQFYHVHHRDYDHKCKSRDTIIVEYTDTMGIIVQAETPDCESCKNDSNKMFMQCMKKLALAHPFCNKRMSEYD